MNASETQKKGKGTVYVLPEVCKGCSFCVVFCPTHCLEFSPGFNSKGYHYPLLLRPEACSGCDICGLYCPDFAIFGVRFKDIEKREPGAPQEPGRPKKK